ncbi:putative diguanylate cyclase YcdT [Andreesenia angusta]|uniref:Putative diguanylate cyclase YcdT n=1 Tax=Andreesenia angusta TaxID=39480 RepID=A0A1S1V7F6_9FIRM|nr:diguanylate cyclase [Andreesenia angusta]OHW61649.1 putative diguanylate cyclase YcdT [Andreesenia angusta]
MKNKIVSLIIASLVSVLLILGFSLIYKEQIDSVSKQNRLLAVQELTVYSDRVQSIINTSLQYAEFIDLLVTTNPDIPEETFEKYSNLILKDHTIIKNIAIAPNAIVKHIYPLSGSEAALNHDLLSDSERRPFVKAAIESKESVTQGPVKAKQGGYLVFNRKAIFLNENSKFWGLSVITIDFDEIIKKIGLAPEKNGYLLALKARKTDGKNDFIWGNPEVFDKDYLGKNISLPNQTWELAIYPVEGWAYRENHSNGIVYFFYVIVAIAFCFVYLTVEHYQSKITLSRKDPLTGTLNKMSFQDFAKKQLLKSKKRHAICVIDLNGFKEVNDTFGHPVGDAVLIEIADRIKTTLRSTDRVSRFGGDEYILFLNDLREEKSLKLVLDRVNSITEEPVVVGDIEIETKFALGYAVTPDDAATYEKLYAIADKRMYKHKESLKNSKENSQD